MKTSCEGTYDKRQKQQIKVRDSEKEFKDYEATYKTHAK